MSRLDVIDRFASVLADRTVWQTGYSGTTKTAPTIRTWFDAAWLTGEGIELYTGDSPTGAISYDAMPIGQHVTDTWEFTAIIRVAIPGLTAPQVRTRIGQLYRDLFALLRSPDPLGVPTRSDPWRVQWLILANEQGPVISTLDNRGYSGELKCTINAATTYNHP
jgi:hypothetical protein